MGRTACTEPQCLYKGALYLYIYIYICVPCSVVGIATGYGLDGPGIESRWRRDFPHLSRPSLGPTQPPVQWVPGFSPGVKSGRGVTLTPHPVLVPLVMKEFSYTSTPPMGRTACTEPQCLYKGVLYLYIYIYICVLCIVVGIATGYGLDGPGIESRWRRDFPHLSKPSLGPTQPPVQWVPGFSPGVKSGRGVTLTSHPVLSPWS